MEALIRLPMAIQMTTLCQVLLTRRSRNRPRDHLATAMPTTAKVCPMASNRTALTRSSITGMSNMFWPKPYSAETVVKMV